jgi:hypothetical protein
MEDTFHDYEHHQCGKFVPLQDLDVRHVSQRKIDIVNIGKLSFQINLSVVHRYTDCTILYQEICQL